MPFEIVRNDITNMRVDAIVNSANPRPVVGLGTDSSIHEKAGPELLVARQEIGPIPMGQVRLQKAPKPYDLYYMVFLNGSSQMGLKALDIQKILGRVAQIVNDNSSVMPNDLQSWLENTEPPITLSQAKISLEEKVRVWSAINKPYQVSLFYKAGPVFLSSEVIIDTPRVVDAAFGIHIQGSDE